MGKLTTQSFLHKGLAWGMGACGELLSGEMRARRWVCWEVWGIGELGMGGAPTAYFKKPFCLAK